MNPAPLFAIRPAVKLDLPTILLFIQELAAYEKLSHEVEVTEERLCAALFPDSGNAAAECIVACEGAEPAGFALFFPTYSTFAGKPGLYLEDLYVRPAFRGRGIGTALLNHVASLANTRGCGRMEWAVLDWNQPAIDVYERLGARRLTDWTTCRLEGKSLTRFA
ncbi:MAG TPA: GNAT family N-acetyltransferase [Rariglobus sp.]|jgi:GNAT superfamily N-acetyltransferase|nr:GNAT family N-acetyltransferase [Rariglobus sp.]